MRIAEVISLAMPSSASKRMIRSRSVNGPVEKKEFGGIVSSKTSHDMSSAKGRNWTGFEVEGRNVQGRGGAVAQRGAFGQRQETSWKEEEARDGQPSKVCDGRNPTEFLSRRITDK